MRSWVNSAYGVISLALATAVGCDNRSADVHSSGSHGTSPQTSPAPVVAQLRGDPSRGKRLWAAFGCATCHAIDGKNPQGPTLKGYWMTVRRLADGREVIADVAYTRRAITEPATDVVPGYPVPMTSFKGLMSDEQIDDLIAYIRSLSN